MKKIITCCMVMATGMLSFTACHEDKENYTYRELVDFYVERQGIPANITIAQFHTLNLPSNLVYGGDKNDLEYTWVTVADNMTTTDTLATTEDLSAPVPATPGAYTLAFTATERESGRSTFQLYNLTVEGSIGTGLLVLHETNGIVDCDLIKTKALVGSLVKDTVLRALYSQANPGYPLTGKPLQVVVSTNLNYVYVSTDADAKRLSTVDMGIMDHFNGLFFNVPGMAKPQGYNIVGGGLMETLVNDGRFHFISVLLMAFGAEKEPKFTGVPGDYHAAPYVVQATALAMPLFYDQEGTRFLAYSTEAAPISSTVPGNAFDFDNVGKKMVYMEDAGSSRTHAIFKNPEEDGKRYLYVMNVTAGASASYVAHATHDISAWPGIASAELFTLSTRGPVGFYATGNRVYRYTYDPNDFSVQPTAEEAWPYIPANETITALQLVKHAGISVPESTLGKYLLVGTYNEASGEGKVYMIEIDVVNGTCITTPVTVYTGFGKVVDMAFKPV
jgi:hypothetical protein